jgi:hypothetical protein
MDYGDGSPSEFILEALNESGDLEDCDDKGYYSDEYDAAMKQFEADLALEELREKQAAAKHVFMTSKGEDGSQAAADLPAPTTKEAQASGVQDDPPPSATATNEEYQ